MLPNCSAVVRAEYEKNENLKRDEIRNLLVWLETQPHLPKITELQAICFLHSCYFDINLAKITVEKYFTLKTVNGNIFDVPSVDVLEAAFRNGILGLMPRRTPDGCIVLLSRLIDPRPETYDCINYFRLFNATLMLEQQQNGTSEGLIVLFDTSHMTFGHFLRINFLACRTMAAYLQEGLPVRLKSIHLANVVPILHKTLHCLKPFIKKEFLDMMKFHSNFETLYEHVPSECLPKELGGDLPSIAELLEDQKRNILSNLHSIEWQNSQTIHEHKKVSIQKKNKQSGILGYVKKPF